MNFVKKTAFLLMIGLLAIGSGSAQTDDETEVSIEAETTEVSGNAQISAPELIAKASEITEQKGFASYYADKFHGNQTSSGEIFDNYLMTAAHNTLAFGTMVKVTNLSNQLSVVVKINDRGPFKPGRIIDLSKAAADKINLIQTGTAEVKIEILNEKGNIKPVKKPVPPVQASKPEGEVGEEIIGTGLYRVDPAPEKRTGFGIQIGAYHDFKSMFHYTKSLHNKGVVNTLIHSGFSNEKPVYRLIIGPYETKAEAEAAKKILSEQKIDGIILTLANLK